MKKCKTWQAMPIPEPPGFMTVGTSPSHVTLSNEFRSELRKMDIGVFRVITLRTFPIDSMCEKSTLHRPRSGKRQLSECNAAQKTCKAGLIFPCFASCSCFSPFSSVFLVVQGQRDCECDSRSVAPSPVAFPASHVPMP